MCDLDELELAEYLAWLETARGKVRPVGAGSVAAETVRAPVAEEIGVEA